MASHEWLFEDVINVEELDDKSINDFNGSHEEESCSPSSPGVMEPDKSRALNSYQSNIITTDPNTSPESLREYDLGSGFGEEPSLFMLPPSFHDIYQPPWSPLNINHGVNAGRPRTTPDFVADESRLDLDSFTTSTPAPETPHDVSRWTLDFDTPASSPPYNASKTDPSLYSISNQGLNPSLTFGSLGNALDGFSDITLPPWNIGTGSLHPIETSFNLNLLASNPTAPSPLPGPSSYTSPNSGTELPYARRNRAWTTNYGPCVSPSQIINSQTAPSSGSLPMPNQGWWPAPDPRLPEQKNPQQPHVQPLKDHFKEVGTPGDREEEDSLSPLSGDADGYQSLLQYARKNWSNVGALDQVARDTALLEMREWGLSYKDIKRIGNFPDALPTLRGRHRILTKPSQDRVRRPPWRPEDEELLRQAVRAQLAKARGRRTQRIIWKEVADHVNQHGSSYKFSYVTCSQKWQQMTRDSQRQDARRGRHIRGRGAFYG
ncbi:hypothetical protein NLU13_2599 [Sarocladium strictum]|uniref:Myb-like domain-containing protein n=1 Tax=Sarocladium strictum TaxID=5046 RepID=A0AA39GN49_SARSR|nr:hypothetical protein NLU13_2599 [Sarocladium strictum]